MRRVRESQGLSQAAIAAGLLGAGIELHFSAIAKMEAGSRVIRLNEAIAIADVLDVPLAALLQPDDELSGLREALMAAEEQAQLAAHKLDEIRAARDALRVRLDEAEAAARRDRDRAWQASLDTHHGLKADATSEEVKDYLRRQLDGTRPADTQSEELGGDG